MVGRTISHYKILARLGSGGMGEVWKAEDIQLRRLVALKFLSAAAVGDEEVKARLIREAQAAASLDHPNICNGAVNGLIARREGPAGMSICRALTWCCSINGRDGGLRMPEAAVLESRMRGIRTPVQRGERHLRGPLLL